jgi:hypothetical protein
MRLNTYIQSLGANANESTLESLIANLANHPDRDKIDAGSEGSVTIWVLKVDFESNTIAPALKVLSRYVRTTLCKENLSDIPRNYVLHQEKPNST